MAEIVVGVGASHSTLMNTHWDSVIHMERAERFRDGLAAARDRIAASSPDVALIVGSNHFRGFWLDLIPPFTMGVGECTASGESGTPSGPQAVDVPLARHIADWMVEGGRFDLAYSARMQIDHGQSHAIQYLLTGLDIPIIPLVVNAFAPPLPSLRRCDELGSAVREAVFSFPGPRRVAVIGSGGLSHELPWPDWRDPHGDDEEFLVHAWLDGRENWSSYDGRRREIIRAAPAGIRPDFDSQFLSLLEKGQADRLTSYSTGRLGTEAGNGGQEIRTWLVMAAALGHAPARRLAYEVLPEWLTGMGVAVIEPLGEPFMTVWTELTGTSFLLGFVDASGVPTRSLRAGSSGDHVVFLHGTSGHLEAFVRNIPAHAAHYRCHAIDMLGHGYTGKPDYPYEIPRYVEHLRNYLDAVGADRVHLVGESLGGWVAAWLASESPGRVASLQLVAAGGSKANPAVMARIKESTLRAVQTNDIELTRKRLELLMYDPAGVSDELVEIRHRIYHQPEFTKNVHNLLCLQEMEIRQRNLLREDRLARITAPTLVVWGHENPFGGVPEAEWLHGAIAGSRLELFGECGHWPQHEHHERFNELSLAFLAGAAG